MSPLRPRPKEHEHGFRLPRNIYHKANQHECTGLGLLMDRQLSPKLGLLPCLDGVEKVSCKRHLLPHQGRHDCSVFPSYLAKDEAHIAGIALFRVQGLGFRRPLSVLLFLSFCRA